LAKEGANRDYLDLFRTPASKIARTLRNEVGINGARMRRLKNLEDFWTLWFPPASRPHSNVAEAASLPRRASVAFVQGDDTTGWALLRDAYAEWPDAGNAEAIAGALILSGGLPSRGADQEWLQRLPEQFAERKQVLIEAMIKIQILARYRAQGVDPDIAAPVLRQWVARIICLRDALRVLDDELPFPPSIKNESVQGFVRLANNYLRTASDCNGVAVETDPVAVEVQQREWEAAFQRLVSCEFLAAAAEDCATWAESLPHLKVRPKQVSEATQEAVRSFLDQRLLPLRPSDPLYGLFCRFLRQYIEADRTGAGISDVCNTGRGTFTSVEQDIITALERFDEPRNIRRFIGLVAGKIPALREGLLTGSSTKVGGNAEPYPFDEIYSAHRLFGGRTDEIDRLNRFMEAKDRAYLFVTGPSGLGKTALLARWAQELQRKSFSTAVHFISSRIHGGSMRFCLSNLCKQLAAFHGTTASPPIDDWDLESRYRQLLPSRRHLVAGWSSSSTAWTKRSRVGSQAGPCFRRVYRKVCRSYSPPDPSPTRIGWSTSD